MAALLAMLVLALGGTQGEEAVATLRLADRQVAVTLPAGKDTPPIAPYVTWHGWHYVIEGRNVVRRERGDFWNRLRVLYQEAKVAAVAEPAVWHTKVVIFPRSNILDVAASGFVRERRASMDKAMIDECLQAAGRLAVAAQAFSRGRIQMALDAEIETELIPQFSEGKEKPYGNQFANWYFEPRLNSGGFEGEDKVFRGPYDSVFYVHVGLTPQSPLTIVRGTPVSDVPYFHHRFADQEEGLSRELIRGWFEHVAYAAGEAGYRGVAAAPLSGDAWTKILRRRSEPVGDYLARLGSGSLPAAKTWAEVSADPLGRLPRLTRPALDKILGAGWTPSSVTVGPDEWVFVPLQTVEFWVGHLRPDANMSPVGTFSTGEANFVVFTGSKVADGPLALPDVQPGLAAAQVGELGAAAFDAVPLGAFSSPNVRLSAADGAISYSEVGQARYGGAMLFRIAPGTQALSFRAKSQSREPLAVNVLNEQEELLASFVLGRVDPSPREIEIELGAKPVGLAFAPDGQWHDEIINLSGVPGAKWLQIGPPGTARFWERAQLEPIVYTFDDFSVRVEGVTTVATAVAPALDSIDEFLRARAVATAPESELPRLLMDQSRLVGLNAIARLRAHPVPGLELPLQRLANDVDPVVSWTALEALDAAGSPASKVAIRRILETSPFDVDKSYAGKLLARVRTESLAGPLSLLFGLRSWQARLMGAEAVAQIPGNEAAVILMVFLQESNPTVRLAATAQANPSVELVARRMAWAAENDPSDAVRSASFAKLLASPSASSRAQGLKGTKDPSSSVRLGVLATISSTRVDGGRAAALAALADPSSEVRAQALAAVSRYPEAPTVEELQNVLLDPHPRVQGALIRLARDKQVRLPSESVESLRKSVDPTVVELAKELPN